MAIKALISVMWSHIRLDKNDTNTLRECSIDNIEGYMKEL